MKSLIYYDSLMNIYSRWSVLNINRVAPHSNCFMKKLLLLQHETACGRLATRLEMKKSWGETDNTVLKDFYV
jgi:hypothetical protein